mmetsp:Transcript_3153/g.4942  ORF Transcript_3153/g.4942 Transcript_3153/m.4942 type:complete len:237 (+) Transcript_3153:68-778(+)|eukprot:CAMPEP_0201662098 /NCGR_PEP_ID=MMETSP0494-20130426/4292_1 /ASSEMBLY_ACC=CAM_ASM_000839 /TAXON_ID=420259 /ORGANISM="Thalassiosira gravida, Strain GMp14c1" /LENGTH=236 /DNA_ID=CAMNT_0048140389 /DNA_START=17 /DNA_END=727 /DNA_ORIENTATION=-
MTMVFPIGVRIIAKSVTAAAPPLLQRRLATTVAQRSSSSFNHPTLSAIPASAPCYGDEGRRRRLCLPVGVGNPVGSPVVAIHHRRTRTTRSFSSAKSTPSPPTKMVPRKAALALTPKSREIFRKLIETTNSQGILLKYEISSQHALRMAFKFDLIKDAEVELTDQDEGVSLELSPDGITPKPPSESWNDDLPKLYIHSAAFMKVLGGTLDVEFNSETGILIPKLLDREGHEMEPNA